MKTTCPMCEKSLTPTLEGRFRKHKGKDKDECEMAGLFVPGLETSCEFPPSAETPNVSSAESSPGVVDGSASLVTSSTGSSPPSPEPEGDASTASAPPVLPGVTEYAEGLNDMAAEQLAAYKASVDSELTPYSQPAPDPEVGEQLPFSTYIYSQPASAKASAKPEVIPMTRRGTEITARLKEVFYAYGNRRTSDNRSAQATLGPSEIGTPCDRRLAMSQMQRPPVNPGGDGWASFVGTCIHAGLAEMFLWANGGTGRYEVEMPLKFPSELVPKGTGDLLDRTQFMFLDHKCQGQWSRGKLKTQGPGETYRVQVHVYAYGATLRGEKVEHVAIVSWPREASSLDDMYTWTEPYNPSIAHEAMRRVEAIASDIKDYRDDGRSDLDIASGFDVAPDCTYCPFYLPKAKHLQHGCNGGK